ncbi:MAG: YcxB family protein [Corallococcus sp.]|nr:YcxB family protein [Corallococcus sp.]
MIKFESKFNAERTKQLNAFQMKKIWWVYLLCSLIFAAIGVIELFDKEEGVLAFAIFMIAFGVLFTPLCMLLTKLIQKNINKSMSIMSDETVQFYTFEEDRFTIRDSKGDDYSAEVCAKYSYFYKVVSTRDTYLLYLSSQQCHVLPKNSIVEGTLDELDAIFRRQLQGKFTVKK